MGQVASIFVTLNAHSRIQRVALALVGMSRDGLSISRTFHLDNLSQPVNLGLPLQIQASPGLLVLPYMSLKVSFKRLFGLVQR